MELQCFAGKQDGDNEAQVQAIENLISAGAKGFMITAERLQGDRAVAGQGQQAGHAGDRAGHPDRPAGRRGRHLRHRQLRGRPLIGQWAKAKFEAEGKQAKIAMLDLNANQVSVDVQRDQGFLAGFGIDVGDKTRSATRPTRGSSATTSPTAPRRAAARRWRTCCRRTRRSTSSTRSTSRRRPARTRR